MPPRRARATRPLPTPTSSTSTSPTKSSATASVGLVTPNSMVDEDVPAARKRKATSPAASPAPKRKVFDGVAIPKAPSKLGTEKTTSLDNLTLNSSLKRKEEPDDVVILSDHTVEDKPTVPSARPTRSTRSTRASAPKYTENYGSETEEDTPIRGSTSRQSNVKGKARAAPKNGRAKGKAKIIAISDSDDGDDDTAGTPNQYAMNSEDEAEQLAKAIKASGTTTPAKACKSSTASASSSTSTTPARGARGKKAKSVIPLRTAIVRAAERRTQGSRATTTDMDDSSEYGTLVSDPSEVATPDGATEESELSDLSDYQEGSASEPEFDSGSEFGSDEEPLVKKKRPAKKTATKPKGRRLDGEEGEEMPDDWNQPTKEQMDAIALEIQRQKAEKVWIKSRERKLAIKMDRKLTQGEKNHIRLCLHHPELEDAWGDLAANVEPVKPVPMDAHPSLKLTLLPFQKESLYWMKKQEEGPWKGGMLADEMGMGKTIQTIALLLSEPRRKPSLVVAPVVALMQWKSEIETHAEGFTVCLWHGSGRMKAEQLKKFDVVLVSYGTLEASFRRQQNGFKKNKLIIKEKSPMHTFEWFRVILDEAHNIKERTTNAAKAAFALQAKYRWCLSGTPLQNRVGELYSLVRFLGADPFSYYFCKRCDCKALHWKFSDRRHCDDCGHSPMEHVSLWNSEILHPIARYGIEEGGPGKTAFKKLKILLDRMMLRRTKLERADDLGLPPRTIVVRRDFFSPAEKEIYLSLFTNARRTFNTYLDSGTVLNNYSNIFSLITRMRQMACHPDLVLKSKTSTLAQKVNEGTVCRICNDTAEDAIVSACRHVFDRECIRQYLEVQQGQGHPPECPVCHIDISIDLEQEAVDVEENTKAARQGILSRLDIDNWKSSSKLEALVEELERLRSKDCTIKSLVFSQFVSFLDLIAFRLQRAGFNVCRLEGGMTPQQRDATIQHFMKNTQVTVFLISLKAGGVALNLTEASMVFMMDSWWNPSTEYQAMDRIHRLGQKRPVTVIKFVVQDSIEDQIVQLQAKKLAMTDAALSRDPDAALGKLTVEDLGFLFKL